ncbi:MAG: glycosyltransferase [Chloroflexi bacterium]|nr:glycosyltransferase [Chloroflexota bacterium]
MRPLWLYFELSVVAFAACLVLISLSNWRLLRRMDCYRPPLRTPRVSVLVPARNEEAYIGDCVRSLLAQDYPDFEVAVLNDHSTDRTGQILADLSAGGARLRVLEGADLPDGWLGKHWACQQLADASDGELLLFTDADTRHDSRSIRHGVAALEAEGADLLTALPHEETVTWAEQLIVPVVPWSILTFLPLAVAYRTSSPALSATIGQYMLFRKSAYSQIGGHAAVRSDPVDDMALGRRIKALGFRWRLADATCDVRCRMYQNASQVFEGFSKNLFAAFGNRLLPFIGVWVWLSIVFLLPIGLLLAGLLGAPIPALDAGIALAGIAAGLASWGLCTLRFGFPARTLPLYPVTVLLALSIAVRSVVLVRRGRTTWKGRTLAQGSLRWW